MDSRAPRNHQQRLRTPRGPATPFQPRGNAGRNPSSGGGRHPSAVIPDSGPISPSPFGASAPFAVRVSSSMEDDTLTTLMDIDDASPRSAHAHAAGFLYDDDDDGELLHSHRMGGAGNRAGEPRGPLAFAGFFNTFDGNDFDDDDIA